MKTLLMGVLMLLICSGLKAQRHFKVFEKNTMTGTKAGVFDKDNGDTIIQAKYDKIKSYSDDGYFDVELDDKMGIVDTNGKEVIPVKHYLCSNIYEGRLFIGNGDKLALADKTGKLLTGYIYESAANFSDGICRVKMKGLYGFINKTGTVVIPCKYTKADQYIGGVVVVHTNKWEQVGTTQVTQYNKTKEVNVGYTTEFPVVLNKQGGLIYKGTNEEDIAVTGLGTIIATKSTTNCREPNIGQMMDLTGKILYPYTKCSRFDLLDDVIITRINTGKFKYGLLGYDGKELLKSNFQDIREAPRDEIMYYKVSFESGDFFYVDNNGKCTELDGKKCPQ